MGGEQEKIYGGRCVQEVKKGLGDEGKCVLDRRREEM